MKRALILISALALLSGCTALNVDTEEGTQQNAPAKGVVVIPQPKK